MKLLDFPDINTAAILAAPPSDTSVAKLAVAGSGIVALQQVNGRTQVVTLSANSPLRLLSPRQHSSAAWIVCGSYGGGLLDGDQLDLQLQCGDGTTAVLSTQASTKVFRAAAAHGGASPGASQIISAAVGEEASLVVWPDPVTCFAGARYAQVQQYELERSASLLAVDWMTSGRMARGERWSFSRFASRTTVHVQGQLRVHEALTLDAQDGEIDSASRTGGRDCLGMAWLIGPRFREPSELLLRRLGRAPIDPRQDVLFAVSPLRDGGAVLRFAARATESAWRWLRRQLRETIDIAGFDPWARRGDADLSA